MCEYKVSERESCLLHFFLSSYIQSNKEPQGGNTFLPAINSFVILMGLLFVVYACVVSVLSHQHQTF